MGICSKGSQCPFAHDEVELQSAPDHSRTKMCPILKKAGVCSKPDCQYAHNRKELRTTGAFYSALYKTKICQYWQIGDCSLGERCCFAHSTGELRAEPGKAVDDGFSTPNSNKSTSVGSSRDNDQRLDARSLHEKLDEVQELQTRTRSRQQQPRQKAKKALDPAEPLKAAQPPKAVPTAQKYNRKRDGPRKNVDHSEHVAEKVVEYCLDYPDPYNVIAPTSPMDWNASMFADSSLQKFSNQASEFQGPFPLAFSGTSPYAAGLGMEGLDGAAKWHFGGFGSSNLASKQCLSDGSSAKTSPVGGDYEPMKVIVDTTLFQPQKVYPNMF